MALAVVLTGILAASTGAEAAVATLTAPGVARERPAPDAPIAPLSDGIKGLGYDLGRVAAPADRNWVVSPLSIASAFAMARAGAHGETAAQLDRVLGFPTGGTDAAFNALTWALATAADPAHAPDPANGPEPAHDQPGAQRPVVTVANGLFPQRGLPIGAAYLHTLAAQYGVGVHPVDFGSPDATATINAWVRRQTADRIRALFDRLPGDTQLVLANAVYFKGDWREPFDAASTRSEPFTRAGGGQVRVPMMHRDSRLRYAEGPGWQAVELPYAGDDLAMWILLPAPGTAPDPLLAPRSLARVSAGLHDALVDLALPKWDFATSVDLREQLGRLGLTEPFRDGADFSGITPGLFIDQAVHRATSTVDEKGTEAAAVTGMAMTTAAIVAPPVRVRADRPFAFALVHRPTGTPLFTGHVADPSAG